MKMRTRRILSLLLVLAMVVGFIPAFDLGVKASAAGEETPAEPTAAVYAYVADISEYRVNTEVHDANNDDKHDLTAVYSDYPAKEGYVFAGWFVDQSGSMEAALPAEITSGGAYAKFVPERLMKAVAQVSITTDYTTAASSLRFVAAVDSLNYAQVGFKLNKEGSAKTYSHATGKVYTSLSAALEGGSLKPGYFGEAASYMYALTVTGIKDQSANYVATPFWITLDGTKVDHIPTTEKAVEMGIKANVAAGKTEIPENMTWYTNASVLYISNAEEFKAFAEMTKTDNFAGKTIKLSANIDLNPGVKWADITGASGDAYVWPGLGTLDVPFAGTIDGCGHTISKLTAKATGTTIGFIVAAKGATVKNLTLDASYIQNTSATGTAHTGVIAGWSDGITIDNVVVTKDVTVRGGYTMGLVGTAQTGTTTIKNSWSAITIQANYNNLVNVGGFLGHMNSTGKSVAVIENCLFTGTTKGTFKTGSYVGGIVGIGAYNNTVTITDTLSAGNINAVAGVTVYNGTCYVGSVIANTPGNGKGTYTDVYATNECAPAAIAAGTKYTGTVTLVANADIQGYNAFTNASGLDYANSWAAQQGGIPVPKVFAENNGVDISWYDSTKTEFVITTAAQLNGLVYLSKTNTFAGKTVKLGADITYNTGNAADWATTAPAYSWSPIGDSADGWKGTFDGQNHTISGLYCSNTGYATFIARMYAGGALKNVKIVNSYFVSTGTGDSFHNGAGILGRVTGAPTITGIYTDAYLKGVKGVGIIAFSDSGANTITNCWFDGTIDVTGATNVGGIVGSVANSVTHTISNCLFTGTVTGTVGGSAYVGGIYGIAPYSAKVNMTNCLVAGDMTGATGSGKIGAIAGNVPGGNGSTHTNVYATAETHANLAGAGGTLSKFTVTAVAEANILGDGAKSVLTGLTFNNPLNAQGWYTRENDVPAFGQYTIEGVDVSWYDESATEFVLMDEADLFGFVYLCNTSGLNFSGKTVKLGADMVLNTGDATTWGATAPANAWTPIKAFSGTFDGQNHTISGLYLKSTATDYDGMFKLNSGAIKNFTLTNSYVSGSGKLGAVVGAIDNGSVTNVHVNATVAGGNYVGGLIGYHGGGGAITIDGCSFDGAITGASYLGGILGFRQNAGNETIKNCTVSGTISGTGNRIGGVAGFSQNTSGTITVENCTVDATISNTSTAQSDMGGILGCYLAATVTVNNCHYTGNMTAGAYGSGGIVGAQKTNTTIENCSFTGEIIGANHWIGGMVGYVYGGTITLVNNMSTGHIVSQHSSNSAVGSLIGRNNGGTVNATGCYGVLNAYYKTSTLKESQVGQGTVNGSTALINNKVRDLMEAYYNAGVVLDFSNNMGSYYANSSFEISNLGQLAAFDVMGQAYDFSGKTVKLTADITVNEGDANDWTILAPSIKWMPIGGLSSTKFAGTFDGQGHTISGIYCAHNGGNSMGLFREVSGTLTNFKLVNSYFANTIDTTWGYNGGIVAALTGGTLSKVYTDAIVETVGAYAGGLVGYTTGTTATISQCVFDGVLNARCYVDHACDNQYGAIRAHARYVGGVVGNLAATNTIVKDCVVTATILNTDNGAHRTGGIIGGAYDSGKTATITGCFSLADFRADVNSYHFNMIMDARNNSGTTQPTNAATLYTDNYVLTAQLHTLAGAVLNDGGNLTGGNQVSSSTIRYTADEMANKVGYAALATNNLDFVNIWKFNKNALPTLQWLSGANETGDLNFHYLTTEEGGKLLSVSMPNGTYDQYVDMTVVESEAGKGTYTDDNGDQQPYLHLTQVNDAPVEFKDIFYGAGTYLTKYTGTTLADTQALVAQMKAFGFTEYTTSTLSDGDVTYTALTFGDYVYAVTYFANTQETYISASEEQKLSPYMNETYYQTAVNTAMGEPSGQFSDVTITSVALDNGGDAFIIRLKNGHYIIVDGGTNRQSDRDRIAEALGATTASDGTKQPQIVVDAWFFTHSHADHAGIFRGGIYGAMQVDVYIKGFYYNFTEKWHQDAQIKIGGTEAAPVYTDGYANAAYYWENQDEETGISYYRKGIGDSSEFWVEYTATHKTAANVNTPAWGSAGIPIYRVQAGQKFYFDGITVEVPYTQEQVQPSEMHLDLNGTGSWFLFTDDYGQTFLDAGDAERFNAVQVTELYSADYALFGADVGKTFHHGLNPLVEFTGTYGETPSGSTASHYNYDLVDKIYGINSAYGDGQQTQFAFVTKTSGAGFISICGYTTNGGSQRDLSIHEMRYLFGYDLGVRSYNVKNYKTTANPIPFSAYGGKFEKDGYTDTFEGTTIVTMSESGITWDKHHTTKVYDQNGNKLYN